MRWPSYLLAYLTKELFSNRIENSITITCRNAEIIGGNLFYGKQKNV